MFTILHFKALMSSFSIRCLHIYEHIYSTTICMLSTPPKIHHFFCWINNPCSLFILSSPYYIVQDVVGMPLLSKMTPKSGKKSKLFNFPRSQTHKDPLQNHKNFPCWCPAQKFAISFRDVTLVTCLKPAHQRCERFKSWNFVHWKNGF